MRCVIGMCARQHKMAEVGCYRSREDADWMPPTPAIEVVGCLPNQRPLEFTKHQKDEMDERRRETKLSTVHWECDVRVPDDVITMSHRNVKPHVSIKWQAAEPRRARMVVLPTPPSKGVGAPHQCSRVSKKRSGWGEFVTYPSPSSNPYATGRDASCAFRN